MSFFRVKSVDIDTSNLQTKVDDSLNTTSKIIPQAINEVNEKTIKLDTSITTSEIDAIIKAALS